MGNHRIWIRLWRGVLKTTDFGRADGLSSLINCHLTDDENSIIDAGSAGQAVTDKFSEAAHATLVTSAEVRRSASHDPIIRQAIKFARLFWPHDQLSGELLHLYQRRESLSVVQGCLMRSHRTVVPRTLQPRLLQQFHTGHPLVNRMKAIARSHAHWLRMDEDIISTVHEFSKCQEVAEVLPKQTTVSWLTHHHPWSRLHPDFARPIKYIHYSPLVDALSRWPKAIPTNPTPPSGTITALRRSFSQYDVPE